MLECHSVTCVVFGEIIYLLGSSVLFSEHHVHSYSFGSAEIRDLRSASCELTKVLHIFIKCLVF